MKEKIKLQHDGELAHPISSELSTSEVLDFIKRTSTESDAENDEREAELIRCLLAYEKLRIAKLQAQTYTLRIRLASYSYQAVNRNFDNWKDRSSAYVELSLVLLLFAAFPMMISPFVAEITDVNEKILFLVALALPYICSLASGIIYPKSDFESEDVLEFLPSKRRKGTDSIESINHFHDYYEKRSQDVLRLILKKHGENRKLGKPKKTIQKLAKHFMNEFQTGLSRAEIKEEREKRRQKRQKEYENKVTRLAENIENKRLADLDAEILSSMLSEEDVKQMTDGL